MQTWAISLRDMMENKYIIVHCGGKEIVSSGYIIPQAPVRTPMKYSGLEGGDQDTQGKLAGSTVAITHSLPLSEPLVRVSD